MTRATSVPAFAGFLLLSCAHASGSYLARGAPAHLVETEQPGLLYQSVHSSRGVKRVVYPHDPLCGVCIGDVLLPIPSPTQAL